MRAFNCAASSEFGGESGCLDRCMSVPYDAKRKDGRVYSRGAFLKMANVAAQLLGVVVQRIMFSRCTKQSRVIGIRKAIEQAPGLALVDVSHCCGIGGYLG